MSEKHYEAYKTDGVTIMTPKSEYGTPVSLFDSEEFYEAELDILARTIEPDKTITVGIYAKEIGKPRAIIAEKAFTNDTEEIIYNKMIIINITPNASRYNYSIGVKYDGTSAPNVAIMTVTRERYCPPAHNIQSGVAPEIYEI